jgi:hypothetical protein
MYGTGGKLEFEIRERNGVGRLFESHKFFAEELPLISFFLSSANSVPLFYESRAFGRSCRARARARSGVEEKKLDYFSEFISEGGKEKGGLDESDDGGVGGRGGRKRGGLCCQAQHWRKQCWYAAGNHGSRAQVRHLVNLLIIIVFLLLLLLLLLFFFFFLVVTVVLFLRAFGIGVFSNSSPSSSSSSSSPSHFFFFRY